MIRKLYEHTRNLFPEKIQGNMSRIVFKLLRKPLVLSDIANERPGFPNDFRGGMVISADFELAWAWRFAKKAKNPLELSLKKARNTRNNFPMLISLFNEYKIPVTWATVGSLFLKHSRKSDFDWMQRIPHFENKNWIFNKSDWFDNIPFGSWEKAKEWYAPDLIENLLDSEIDHEIGCHTFSHIDFSYENCPSKVAEDEIIACINASKSFKIKMVSFIFPGGTLGNYEILKKYGLKIYRKSIDYDMAYPYFDNNGLVITPRGDSFEGGLEKGWTYDYILYRLKKYIDKAISTGTIAHFWFHPSLDKIYINNIMKNLLKYASEKREKGELWIGTMKDLYKLFISRNTQ